MKKYIMGMAYRRADLAAWIEDHTFPVMGTLAQLYLFPTASTQSHGTHDVWEKFHSMHVLKGSNKLPSAQFILQNSWEVNKSFVESAVNWAIGKEYQLTPRTDADLDRLTAIMAAYFDWLAHELSTVRVVNPAAVATKLAELSLISV